MNADAGAGRIYPSSDLDPRYLVRYTLAAWIIFTIIGCIGIVLSRLGIGGFLRLDRFFVNKALATALYGVLALITIYGFVGDVSGFISLIKWYAIELNLIRRDDINLIDDGATHAKLQGDVEESQGYSGSSRIPKKIYDRFPIEGDMKGGWRHLVSTNANSMQMYSYNNEIINTDSDMIKILYESDSDKSTKDEFQKLMLMKLINGTIENSVHISFKISVDYPSFDILGGYNSNSFGVGVFKSGKIIPESVMDVSFLPYLERPSSFIDTYFIGATFGVKFVGRDDPMLQDQGAYVSFSAMSGNGNYQPSIIETGGYYIDQTEKATVAKISLDVNVDGFFDMTVISDDATRTIEGRLPQPFGDFDTVVVWLPHHTIPVWEKGSFSVTISEIQTL